MRRMFRSPHTSLISSSSGKSHTLLTTASQENQFLLPRLSRHVRTQGVRESSQTTSAVRESWEEEVAKNIIGRGKYATKMTNQALSYKHRLKCAPQSPRPFFPFVFHLLRPCCHSAVYSVLYYHLFFFLVFPASTLQLILASHSLLSRRVSHVLFRAGSSRSGRRSQGCWSNCSLKSSSRFPV